MDDDTHELFKEMSASLREIADSLKPKRVRFVCWQCGEISRKTHARAFLPTPPQPQRVGLAL